MRRRTVTLLTGVSAVALIAVSLFAAPSATAGKDPMREQMSAVPAVRHVPRTASSYPFAAADHARVPLDLATYGYVEEEFFLTGYANVYTKASGRLAVKRTAVPYTNRILVRHPARASKASGVVFVDIYNASNGYDIEDMWRRLYTNILEQGHTYVGVTTKPINVDALYNFDHDRYRDLSWFDNAACRASYEPTGDAAEFAARGGAWADVPCMESGLVWDILTQTANALRDRKAGREILGRTPLKSVFLIGQSQSGLYLNTYVNNFHSAVRKAHHGENAYDGYLTAAGGWLERPIRDGENHNPALVDAGGVVMLAGPTVPVKVDVPWISVDSESDTALFPAVATMPRRLARHTRVWQIPGTGHTYSWSPVVQDNAELVKAGRPERVFPTVYTPYPMEPAMIAAAQRLIDNHRQDKPLPATKWFKRDRAGQLVRDDHGNVLGGVRYGLIALPLAEFRGYSEPGDQNGVAYPITAAEFYQNWRNRSQYLAEQRAYDSRLRRAGYLTPDGQELFAERANLVMDRIGIRR